MRHAASPPNDRAVADGDGPAHPSAAAEGPRLAGSLRVRLRESPVPGVQVVALEDSIPDSRRSGERQSRFGTDPSIVDLWTETSALSENGKVVADAQTVGHIIGR